MTRRVPLRLLALAALLASGPAAAQVWPAPGDGFDWQAVGDRPAKAQQLAFDDLGRLWAATQTQGTTAVLSDPDDPASVWVSPNPRRGGDRVVALGRGDTVLVGEGFVHLTIDAGETWNDVMTPCSIRGGAMIEVPFGTPPGPWGDLSGVLLAGNRGLCRSDDRGETWTEIPHDPTPAEPIVTAAIVLPAGHAHAGRVVVGGRYGVWLSDETRSTLHLRLAGGPAIYYPEHYAVMPSGRLLVTGIDPTLPHRRVEVSDDGGESWRQTAALPEPGDGISGDAWLAVVGPQTAVAIGGRGVVYRTDDDGETWAVVGRVPITESSLTSRHVLIGPQGRMYVAVMRAGAEATDAWVWRTAAPVLVADEAPPSAETFGVSVRPNPSARGTVTVAFSQASPQDVRAEVFDAVGRRVAVLHEGAAGAELSWTVDTSRWAPGVYSVRVTSGEGVAVASFSVVR